MSSWPDFLTVRPVERWLGQETAERRRSPFSAPWSSTLQLLDDELRHAQADDAVLQVCIPEADFGVRGYPLAHAKAWSPGVILSFNGSEGSLSFPCDSFERWQDNLRAIALTMESLRRINRYGVAQSGEQYRGWRAIESTATTMTADEARDRLSEIGGAVGNETDKGLVRRARAIAHPDRHDGDTTRWDEVAALAALLGVTL
ncbi:MULTISPECIES: molecular chaperone DnaJ [unclassified Dietzia]|uniref:molecular chaperone DnaJ n=1 Tax=unclassified Dietzia TaxID=2617939 RepID=UPI0015F9D09A|nr:MULTISPECIES: molecular chaperone DnaJ [unclassified Dietzia]MBB1025879.1 molecular chaperone DnaJ [Dietzia sp. DQ12-76]MBB1028661.1 molecular chaperone DnaJ [Dietzia sp. DQ11-38-2]